jgi:multidrug efflux system outer membrane protein
MQKVLHIFTLLIILGFSGCMLGPDFQRPQYAGPDTFRFDSAETAQTVNLRWWELMEDPVLDTLIKIALEENKDVLVAAARIESARANIGYTKAEQWPVFHYSAGVNAGGSGTDITSGFTVYPGFSWEIGFWGKYRRLNEAARAEYMATEYAKRTVQLSLVSSVASTYFFILASYDQLAIAKNTLASRDSALIIMKDKLDGGMISKMDYNQAKIERDIAAATIPTYRRIIAINENTLSILLGRMPQHIAMGRPFYEHEYEMDIPVGIPSELIERRPDVLQAEAIYEAQNAQIGVAEALRWPSLNLTGLLGVASTDLLSLNAIGLTWSASADILGPLFQFGQNKRRVEMARQNALMSLIDYEKTVQQAFKDVEDALVSISTYREEVAVQESRSETAIESESLSYVRYNEGSTTYLEVLEQQRQSFSSRLQVLTARLNLLNSYILLYKALGGGWLSPEEEKAYLDSLQNKNNQ